MIDPLLNRRRGVHPISRGDEVRATDSQGMTETGVLQSVEVNIDGLSRYNIHFKGKKTHFYAEKVEVVDDD